MVDIIDRCELLCTRKPYEVPLIGYTVGSSYLIFLYGEDKFSSYNRGQPSVSLVISGIIRYKCIRVERQSEAPYRGTKYLRHNEGRVQIYKVIIPNDISLHCSRGIIRVEIKDRIWETNTLSFRVQKKGVSKHLSGEETTESVIKDVLFALSRSKTLRNGFVINKLFMSSKRCLISNRNKISYPLCHDIKIHNHIFLECEETFDFTNNKPKLSFIIPGHSEEIDYPGEISIIDKCEKETIRVFDKYEFILTGYCFLQPISFSFLRDITKCLTVIYVVRCCYNVWTSKLTLFPNYYT